MSKNFELKRKILSDTQKRGFFWYFYFFLFIGIFFLMALFSSNFLFSSFLILFTIIYWFLDIKEREDKYLNVYLNNDILKINDETFFLNKSFVSYEFIEQKDLKKIKGKINFPILLRLDFRNRWRSSLFIPIKENEKEKIEKILIDNQLKCVPRKIDNFLEELKKLLKI